MGEVFFPLEEVFLSFMIMVREVEVLGGKAKYLYIYIRLFTGKYSSYSMVNFFCKYLIVLAGMKLRFQKIEILLFRIEITKN